MIAGRGLWLAAFAAACSAGSGPNGDTDGDTDHLPTCGAPGVVTQLTDGLTGGTEGLAITEDGTLYAVNDQQLLRVAADGTKTPVAETPGGVGAAWWNGDIWVASWKDADGNDEGSLLQITADGVVTHHPTPDIAKPNFLAPTPWGTLLVSDDFDTKIFEVDASAAVTTWATDVPSPNGMGFSPDGSQLYVVSTFVPDPPLSSIAVTDGAAGERTVVHTFESGSAPDGLVVAKDGAVLVAVNVAGRIDVWQDGHVGTIASGLEFPASLVFGRGEFDGCSVIATSLFGETMSVVTAGHEGQ